MTHLAVRGSTVEGIVVMVNVHALHGAMALTGGKRLHRLGHGVEFPTCIVIGLTACAFDVKNVPFTCKAETANETSFKTLW